MGPNNTDWEPLYIQPFSHIDKLFVVKSAMPLF